MIPRLQRSAAPFLRAEGPSWRAAFGPPSQVEKAAHAARGKGAVRRLHPLSRAVSRNGLGSTGAIQQQSWQCSGTVRPMEMRLEVVQVPVADVDRSKSFYTEKLGFVLDHDVEYIPGMRVVQLTPPGSAASIVVGTGMTSMAPGSLEGLSWSYPTSVRRGPNSCPGVPISVRSRTSAACNLPIRRPGRQPLGHPGCNLSRRHAEVRRALRSRMAGIAMYWLMSVDLKAAKVNVDSPPADSPRRRSLAEFTPRRVGWSDTSLPSESSPRASRGRSRNPVVAARSHPRMGPPGAVGAFSPGGQT